MPDRRPPHSATDERTTALELLQFQRESFLGKVSGIDDDLANAALVPSGTTLLWLTNHVADAERIWLLHRFRSEDPSADPPHEATIAGACDRYRATWAVSDDVIRSTPDLGATTPPFDGRGIVSLRWILLHLLEETARHAGHADIIRELLDGTTGR